MTRAPDREPGTDSPKRRHDIRLSGYDYSTPGTYFVTVCVQNRSCIFGDVHNGEMVLNDVGCLIESWWIETDRRFDEVETDAFVIMPNHVHALVRLGWTDGSTLAERFPNRDTTQRVVLIGDASAGGSRHGGLHLRGNETPVDGESKHGGLQLRGNETPVDGESKHGGLQRRDDETVSLGRVMQWFKSATTTAYAREVKERGWMPFPGRLWQKNYYEHIIRDEESLDRARAYVLGNPGKWSEDKEFQPSCQGFT